MVYELCNCTNVLLAEVNNPKIKPESLAITYKLAMHSSEDVNWRLVNTAIVERWSASMLEKIKRMAVR